MSVYKAMVDAISQRCWGFGHELSDDGPDIEHLSSTKSNRRPTADEQRITGEAEYCDECFNSVYTTEPFPPYRLVVCPFCNPEGYARSMGRKTPYKAEGLRRMGWRV